VDATETPCLAEQDCLEVATILQDGACGKRSIETCKQLVGLLKKVPFVERLPKLCQNLLVKYLELETGVKDRIYEADMPTTHAYILLGGTVQLYTMSLLGETRGLVALQPGCTMGENGLGQESMHTSTALVPPGTDVTVAKLSAENYKRVVQHYAALEALQKVPLLARLPSEIHNRVCESVQFVSLPDKTTIFSKGDVGKELYMIVSGQVRIVMNRSDTSPEAYQSSQIVPGEVKSQASEEDESARGYDVRWLGPGATFGELALVNDQPRSASAVTAGYTELVTLDKWLFRELIAEAAKMESAGGGKASVMFLLDQAKNSIKRPSHKRSQEDVDQILQSLGHLQFLHGLPKKVQADLSRMLKHKTFQAGETLFRVGDSGDTLYILLSGEVHIAVEEPSINGKLLKTVTIYAGQQFGELALLKAGTRRTGTAVAAADCEVATLDKCGAFIAFHSSYAKGSAKASSPANNNFAKGTTKLTNVQKLTHLHAKA